MQFTNYSSDIAVSEWINPPSYSFPGGSYACHPIMFGAKIKQIQGTLQQFTTDDEENDFNIRFRYMPADGSYTAPFAPGDGVIMTDLTFSYNTDLNNVIHWYLGQAKSGEWTIPPGMVLFAYVQFKGFSVVSGVNILVHGELSEDSEEPEGAQAP